MVDLEEGLCKGIVVALRANFLEVEIDHYQSIEPSTINKLKAKTSLRLLCTCRRRLSYQGLFISVGDRVLLDAIDLISNRAVIASILPRESWFVRPPVANATQIFVVISLRQPRFDSDQVNRFLLTAEKTGLNVRLLLTKRDLVNTEQLDDQTLRFRGWGYDPLLVSTKTRDGLEDLRECLLKSTLSVFCGPSGVGKSSLINCLLPKASLSVGELSGRLQRGRHTTRNVELITVAKGSRVADTPGFNRPDLSVEPELLPFLFPEIRNQANLSNCRFRNCLHREEPGCVIQKDWERYPLYRTCIDDLINSGR